MIFLFFIAISTITYLFFSTRRLRTDNPIPKPQRAPSNCPHWITRDTITPLSGTKHLLVSAYMDQRVKGFHLRIIGIFKRDSIQTLFCLFCCRGYVSTATKSEILQHSDNFGFPYVTTDVMCTMPKVCSATHVTLLTDPDGWRHSEPTWLPIGNLETEEKAAEEFTFTVCISNVFGRYNNVLQFAQSLEMYR